MTQEWELEVPEGSLKYTKQHNEIQITGFAGTAGRVCIPSEIEGLPVKEIARKAFLSKKTIRQVEVPATVQKVDDWAFAYCDSLQAVSFLGTETLFGKAVFLDCRKLRSIDCPSEDGKAAGTLLAAAVATMDSYYLLNLQEAGSREWLEKWDARMLTLLHTADNEGYSKQVLCGEEDYGSTDYGAYISASRRGKIRLLLLRLLSPTGLNPEMQKEMEDYLLSHTKGSESEESWQVIREEHGQDRDYFELFAQTGCFHKENAAAVIADVKEQDTEMKAFFLQYQAQHFGSDGFFDALGL